MGEYSSLRYVCDTYTTHHTRIHIDADTKQKN